jgi:hypothetical protein
VSFFSGYFQEISLYLDLKFLMLSYLKEKRQNFDPSTPPACAENLHFTLNRKTRRAHGLPVACAQMA